MIFYSSEQFTLYNGDSKQILPTLAENSIDSIVCDPPYELGFMGKSWDSTGIANDPQLWKEVLRVLKPGGHLLAFSGSRTYHRMVVSIEDAGFEIRDQIMWVYGSGFPKSHNLRNKWQGWGTALKPAHEPIVLGRKPFTGTVANNVLTFGTGGINIDSSRVGSEGGTFKASVPEGISNGIYGEGINGTVDIGKLDSGRWPANFIHDGSDEVVALFPDTAPSKAGIRRNKSGMGIHDSEKGTFGKGDVFGGFDDRGSAARFFYCAKANKRDRNEGLDGFDNKNNHPTVKPTDLMRYLCRLITPPNGTILDPFLGSGSTGKAAMYEGFKFVGIELTEEYLPIAKARIEFAINQGGSE